MKEITIQIKDYLDDSDIKAIISSELHSVIHRDAERILSNMAYHVVLQLVDNVMSEEMQNQVIENTQKVISELGAYAVFSGRGYHGSEKSVAQDILEKTVYNNREIIVERVIDHMKHCDLHIHEDTIGAYMADAFMELLERGNKNKP